MVCCCKTPFNIFQIYTSDAWQCFRVKISHMTRLDYQPLVGRRARAPLPNGEIERAAEMEPKARFRRLTFHEAEANSNEGRTKLIRPTELIQKPILIAAELSSKGRKMLISVKLLTKYVITIYAFGSVHEKFGV